MKKFKVRIYGPKVPLWLGVKKIADTKKKTKTVRVSIYLLTVEVTVPMKHMSIKDSSRDMQELMDKNILCTGEGFNTRLEALKDKIKS